MNLLEKYPVFERVPEGWKIIRGAINRPPGYRWIGNGKSRFSVEYKKGFIPAVAENAGSGTDKAASGYGLRAAESKDS